MNNLTVYSCVSGGYDDRRNDGRIYVDPSDRYKHERMNAKVAKVLSHKYTDTEWSIWVDSNMEMRYKYEQILELFLDTNPDLQVGVFEHPDRKYISEEIDVCKRLGLDDKERLDYHKQKENGNRLAYCGIIIRRNTELVKQHNEQWWAEISRGSSRDQCSFPYTLGKIATYIKLEPPPKFNGIGIHCNNKYYQRMPHRKGRFQ